MTELHVPYGEHSTFVASTGEGKTWALREWAAATADRSLVIDTEGMDFPDAYFPAVKPERALGALRSDKPFRLRVEWPVGDAGRDRFDAFCYGMLKRGHHARILIDEVADFSDASWIGDGLLALVRKGRKRGLSIFPGTQRPQHLHKIFPSQSRHLFVGYLDEEDQGRWDRNSGPPWLKEWLPKLQSGEFKWVYRRKGKYPIRILPPFPKHAYAPVPRRSRLAMRVGL